MPKAVQGRTYTVEAGDTLSGIAAQAYGDGTKWRRIWRANQSRLRSGDPDRIFPGEVIIIPGLEPELEQLRRELDPAVTDKDDDAFTLIVDGSEIAVQSARVFRSVDNAADGWTAVVARDLDDEIQNTKLRPYLYNPAQVYLGQHLAIRGKLYTVIPSVSESGNVLNLEGWTFTADLVDSTIKPPYEEKNVTLQKRAKKLVDKYGLPVSFELESDEPFKRVTANATETIHSHLGKLASQRGALMTSDAEGNLLFTRANTDGEPVGTLTEGETPTAELTARFDGRQRFNAYRAISQTPKKNAVNAVSKDERVPESRFFTFTASDTTEGNIQQAADWKRSKKLADALSIPVPVTSWYAPNGELWRENTLVTLVSPSLFVPDGFNFLIRSVEYVYGSAGTTAKLELVPPQVYTGGEITEPWFE